MVKINGEILSLDGKTIAEYLADASYDINRIAVEKNGDIVPKAKYKETTIWKGETVSGTKELSGPGYILLKITENGKEITADNPSYIRVRK